MTGATRLRSDLDRVQALAEASGGRIVLLSAATAAMRQFSLDLHYVVAGSHRYPEEVRRESRLSISLPARYPFQPPVATVHTPIWHPNVFASGAVCLGTKWLATEGLDLFVQRLARLLTFDALLVNTASPANRDAAAWYERARRLHPAAFPSDRPAFGEPTRDTTRGRVGWRDTPAGPARVERICPACARSLRLPSGRTGRVRCPGCGSRFEAST